MPTAVVLETDASDNPIEMYDRITHELNGGQPFTSREHWGGGLISHVAGVTEDGSGVVVDVWEDRASMERWMERVGPLIEREGFQPRVRVIEETHNVVT
jgi:hypothetical protein